MKYGQFIIPTRETYQIKLFSRIPNSPYEYESTPTLIFKGRPANNGETKEYRITKGINGGSDSIYVLCSNLPEQVKIGDMVVFMGKRWTIQSIGYYYDSSRIVNANIMSDEYIKEKCPKGLNIQ